VFPRVFFLLVDRALRRAMIIFRGFAAILTSRAERTIHQNDGGLEVAAP
jgi:hypothetical protein